jgi:hypothetical protein
VPTVSVEKGWMVDFGRPTSAADSERSRMGRTWDASVGAEGGGGGGGDDDKGGLGTKKSS